MRSHNNRSRAGFPYQTLLNGMYRSAKHTASDPKFVATPSKYCRAFWLLSRTASCRKPKPGPASVDTRSLSLRDTAARAKSPQEALAHFGRPEIFNTGQGSQFTSPCFTQVLKDAKVRIGMDGKGRWMDNVFIERLWRSMKYECVSLYAFETGSELRDGLDRFL